MKRNEVTAIKNLQVGDVFYKHNDKSKTVFELVPGEVKTTQYQTYSFFGLKRGAMRFPDTFKGDTVVVYLRSNTEIVKR